MNYIKSTLKKIGNLFLKAYDKFTFKFRKGSIHTKISYLIMGYGNFTRKQIGKGIIFLTTQIAFLMLMISSPVLPENKGTPLGIKAIMNLRHLGKNPGSPFEQGDNSLLMLLYGIFTIVIIISTCVVYFIQINSSYKLDQLAKKK